ncbi:MAG: hypothetical protein IKO73_06470 [Bacteroidaceae bacterium]|nr:hypothetical protein [Bacteroidaceae bacterium]
MRKRSFLLLALTILTFLQVKADIAPTVMLNHNGKRTMYMWDEVQKAVDAAVDGDTIYLSNGTFESFNVTKRIMVRGTGPETIVSGNCTVYIGGQNKLTMPVLDAITFTGNISVTSAYEQLTIRKCQMNDLNFTESDFHDVKLDRCYIQGTLHLTQKVKEFNCFNTKIRTLTPYDYIHGKAYFNHCNIREINDTILAIFDNCVLRYCRSSYKSSYTYYGTCIGGSVLNNCIYPENGDCYLLDAGSSYKYQSGYIGFFFYSPSVKFNNCYQVKIDADKVVDFESSSYLGNDEMKVGCYGGQNPFRLTPELPRVTKSNVEVDPVNKKLNVTLTLSKE